MNIYLLGMLIFVVSICVIEIVTFAFRQLKSPQRAKLRKRLRKYTYIESPQNSDDILRERVLSDIPFINRILLGLSPIRKLDKLIIQGNAPYTPGFYLLLIAFLFVIGYLLGTFFLKMKIAALPAALISAAIPYFYLRLKKQARIEKFRAQMPEALSLIARSLKAGHALPSGIKLAADQFEDPIGPEFSEVLDEINFGVSIADALKNLAEKMNCDEVRYFVVAVILQRETGGNLSELMNSLATLIRENYKFQGKVRTLSAEGRVSAFVLIGLPFFTAGMIKYINPTFLDPLFTEPIGRLMLMASGIFMIFGIIVIQKMISIDV